MDKIFYIFLLFVSLSRISRAIELNELQELPQMVRDAILYEVDNDEQAGDKTTIGGQKNVAIDDGRLGKQNPTGRYNPVRDRMEGVTAKLDQVPNDALADNKDEKDSSCTALTTRSGEDRDGQVIYLDRHNVSCVNNKGGVISMFHLTSPDTTHVQYQYKCCALSPGCKTWSSKTPKEYDGNNKGNARYLDRHPIDCGHDGYISSFKLQRGYDKSWKKKKMQYKYTCCSLPQRRRCYSQSTKSTNDGGGKIKFLDRQTVQCKPDYGLSFFQLSRDANGIDWKYDFRCCALTTGGTCTTATTRSGGDGRGQVIYLDKHKLSCTDNKAGVITMFHLTRPDSTHVKYEYKCCESSSACTTQSKATPMNSDGSRMGEGIYLDRHPVDCGVTGYISSFKLERGRDRYGRVNQMQYRYTCCALENRSPSCYMQSTKYTEDGYGNIVNLDQQTVLCKPGYGLSFFHLTRSADRVYWKYHYRCCSLKSEKVPSCPALTTRPGGDGNGQVIYLDKHKLSCTSSTGPVISMFHLTRPDSTHVQYQYKCCPQPNFVCRMKSKATPLNDDGNKIGDGIYLDRHSVDCGVTGYITSFGLERGRDKYGRVNQMQYRYTCCEAINANLSCYKQSTKETNDGDGKIQNLDQQTVQCKPGYGLSSFQLDRNNNGKYWRYDFRCCSLK